MTGFLILTSGHVRTRLTAQMLALPLADSGSPFAPSQLPA